MKRRLSTYLTEDEIKDILRQPDNRSILGKRDYAILNLMLNTGLRRNEVCGLKTSNLRIEGKIAWLYVIGKGDKERKIPVTSLDLIDSLLSYWKNAGINLHGNDPFFKTYSPNPKKSGAPVTWKVIHSVVKKYTALAKIQKKITPHSLRHTFLTRALRKGADLATVQKLAGHESISSTQVYLHTDEDRMKKAIDSLKD